MSGTQQSWGPITLVRPPIIYSAKTYSTPVTLPLGIASIAGVLQQDGFAVVAVDGLAMGMNRITHSDCGRFAMQGAAFSDVIDRIPKNTPLIGVTVMFSQEWPYLREFIRAVRQRFPEAVIVAGGEHISALPEYSLRDAPELDFVVIGEGEMPLLEMAQFLRDQKPLQDISGTACLRENAYFEAPRAQRMRDLSNLPWPAWHLFDVEAYFRPNFTMGISKGRNIVALATRGCPYQCTFCSNKDMWTTRYVLRPAADVAAEVEHYVERFQATSVDFLDLTAIVKRSWIMQFTSELKRRNLDITWQLPSGTRSEALDEEVLTALRETGCGYLVYAPESGSRRILEQVNKRIDLNKMTASMKLAKRKGLTLKANFVIGFPEERRRDVWQTLLYMWRIALMRVDDADLALFTPYPGSELFRELQASGEIPPLTDAYFEDLIVLYDFTFVRSFCRHIPALELLFYRVFGLSVFYSLSYLRSPSRVWRLIKEWFRPAAFKPNTLFEQRVFDAYVRLLARNHKPL